MRAPFRIVLVSVPYVDGVSVDEDGDVEVGGELS